jgi:hypothetical protein
VWPSAISIRAVAKPIPCVAPVTRNVSDILQVSSFCQQDGKHPDAFFRNEIR